MIRGLRIFFRGLKGLKNSHASPNPQIFTFPHSPIFNSPQYRFTVTEPDEGFHFQINSFSDYFIIALTNYHILPLDSTVCPGSTSSLNQTTKSIPASLPLLSQLKRPTRYNTSIFARTYPLNSATKTFYQFLLTLQAVFTKPRSGCLHNYNPVFIITCLISPSVL